MRNFALVVILVVAASVSSDAASDRSNSEAHQVPSSYQHGVKWELGIESLGPLRFPKPVTTIQPQVQLTTRIPIIVTNRAGYDYPTPAPYVRQSTQPQYPVERPSRGYLPDGPF